MKDLLLTIREYTNFSILCKKNKIPHEYSIVHGDIHILADSAKLKELGYL